MICIILVAGHGTVLENEIKEDRSGKYADLQNVPKALLPGVGGKRILDFWWEAVNMRQVFSEVYLVTNADKYKHFERWATANDFPVENIINDGTTTFSSRLGSVADVQLAIINKNIQDDVMVVAGDMLFQDRNFDVAQVISYFRLKQGNLAIYYEMEKSEQTRSRGIVEVCPKTNRILKFMEKPDPLETDSRLASVVFYCFRRETLASLGLYLEENLSPEKRTFGRYMEWLVNQTAVYGMKLPTGFQLIGQVNLSDYEKWLAYFSDMKNHERFKEPYTARAYARIGLMGNPSDGFNGKTISMTVANFWAEVTIQESDKLILVPHPLNDPTEFGSLHDLFGISRKEGYLGGLRLLQATCKRFYNYCSQQGIALGKRNFTLRYDTNIPRQVGLAGSSAIVAATLKCLMRFFKLTDNDMPKPIQPQFVLSVEEDELFITAGLQDRVIQVYEGLVYMDFSKELMDTNGHGEYVPLDIDCVPPLWLAYIRDPSDSGKIHSNVRAKWTSGDKDIISGMKEFADLTDEAREALEQKDYNKLSELMDKNFELRRRLYGDECLGKANLKMIELARRFGSAVKFPGSGGAVIGLCLDQTNLINLKRTFQAEGYVVCGLLPHAGESSPNMDDD